MIITWLLATLLSAMAKFRANARNNVGQQGATLLSPACGERLQTTLYVVACCCDLLEVVGRSLKPVKLHGQQGPTFLLFRGHRSVVQQCWVHLHGTSNKVAPTRARALHATYIYKYMRTRNQHDGFMVTSPPRRLATSKLATNSHLFLICIFFSCANYELKSEIISSKWRRRRAYEYWNQ